MKDVILHIGMHKTGSSAIQQAFAGFRGENVRYAALGAPNHSLTFARAFAEGDKKYHVWEKLGLKAEEIAEKKKSALERIASQLARKDCDTVMFSGEGVSLVSEEELEALKRMFLRHAERVLVYAYVRGPLEYASSALQQTIKGGLKAAKAPSANYRGRFEKFIRQFGADAVFFREFSKTKLKGGSVVSDFADWIGLRNGPTAAKYANESLSLDATRLLYLFNREGPLSTGDRVIFRARQRFIRALGRALGEGRFVLPAHLARQGVDLEDVAWMERVGGFTFDLAATDDAEAPYDSIDAYLRDLGEDLTPKLRKALRDHAVSGDFGDDLVKMLSRLFYCHVGYTGGFDPQAYLAFNPDVKETGVNVYKHFVEHGVAEGRRFSEN